MVDLVLQEFGRIGVLVNNAGWDKASPFLNSDSADWDRMIDVNLYGVLHTAKAVLPIMAQQRSGALVNLGSDVGRVGSSGGAVYSASDVRLCEPNVTSQVAACVLGVVSILLIVTEPARDGRRRPPAGRCGPSPAEGASVPWGNGHGQRSEGLA
jgi:hypothetical protein